MAPVLLVGNLRELQGGVHEGMPKLIQQYGDPGLFTFEVPSNFSAVPLNKFGGPTIVVANPDLLEELFNRHEDFNKKLFKYSLIAQTAGKGLFASDDDSEAHDAAARVLLPAFALDGMKQYFEIIRSKTTILSDGLVDGSKDGSIDLHPVLSKYTFDVIAEVCFGRDYDAQRRSCPFLENFNKSMSYRETLSSVALQSVAYMKSIMSGVGRKLMRLRMDNDTEIAGIMDAQREAIASGEVNKCPVKDMCSRMMTEPDPKDGQLLDEDIVIQNIRTFLVAGHDSTSSAITMLFYHIACNADVEEKVYQEVMREIGDAPLKFEDLAKLTYCTQVVKENLRMMPPAAAFVKNSPIDRETTLGDYTIPKGSSLMVSLWALHYNPTVWPEPFKFRPERFESEENAKRSPYAWLPFSYGKRACIGQQLSLIEQRMALAMIVRRCHIRLDPKSKLKITQPLFANVSGLHLKFVARAGTMVPPPPTSMALNQVRACSAGLGKIEALAGKKVVVLVGSNMGTCTSFADRLIAKFSELGMVCEKSPLDALASENPPALPEAQSGMALIVTCTYNGLPPENAKAFASWIDSSEAASKFNGVNFSVFGIGNSQWAATYQKFPLSIDRQLDQLGAIRLAELAAGDMDGGQVDMTFARWSMSVMVALFQSADIPLPASLADELYEKITPVESFVWEGKKPQDISNEFKMSLMDSVLQMPILRGTNAWYGTASVNHDLVREDGRSTHHLEITLPEGQTYTAGDHLGVYGANPKQLVAAYLHRIGMSPDAVVKLEGGADMATLNNKPLGVCAVMSFLVELQQLATRTQLKFLARKAEGASQTRLEELAAFDTSAYDEHVVKDRRILLEVLDEFPELRLTFGELLSILPRMKPRFYSISSSPQVLSGAASITVSVVQGTSPSGRRHLGLCSNYLAGQPFRTKYSESLPHGHSQLIVFVKDTGSAFRLPASAETPVIMVGPGTGLAPMRGFIQERVAAGAKENMLFFGCRNDSDFLYREELEAWRDAGVLDLHVGFSRKEGTPKTYVQQLVRQESVRVAELLQLGAHVYVCGDAAHMAPAVREAFESLCAEAGLGSHFVQDAVDQGRYCQDVWAAQSV